MTTKLARRQPFLPPPPKRPMALAAADAVHHLPTGQDGSPSAVIEDLVNSDLLPSDFVGNPGRFFIDGDHLSIGDAIDLETQEWSDRPQAPSPVLDPKLIQIGSLSMTESAIARFVVGAIAGAAGAHAATTAGRARGLRADPERDRAHLIASGLFGGVQGVATAVTSKRGPSAASHTPSAASAMSLASLGRRWISTAENLAMEAARRLMQDGRERRVVWRYVRDLRRQSTRWAGIGRHGVGGTLELVRATCPSGLPSFSLVRDQLEVYRDSIASERLLPLAELWEGGTPVDSIGDRYIVILTPEFPIT